MDFYPTPDGSEVDEEPEIEHIGAFKEPADASHPFTRFDMHPSWLQMHKAQPQDHMAWETQGPMASRTTEHLSYSDQGIVLYRKLLRENIEKVRAGQDPMGAHWDPDHPMIDTNLDESIRIFNRESGEGAEVVAMVGAGPFQWKEAGR